MPFNPLAPVVDYQSMLNRIFWFTTASAVGAVWLLRSQSPAVDAALGRLDLAMAWGGGKALPTPAGYLLPAVAVGMAARVFRWHALISNWLGIRERFEHEVIIAELAKGLDIDLSGADQEHLREDRPRIMRQAFFAYVSPTPPAIDPHLVQQALDAWSWFWIGLMGTLVFAATGVGLAACGATTVGIQTLGGTIIFGVLGLRAMYEQCRRYGAAQVRAILADGVRAATVRDVLAEFAGPAVKHRSAA